METFRGSHARRKLNPLGAIDKAACSRASCDKPWAGWHAFMAILHRYLRAIPPSCVLLDKYMRNLKRRNKRFRNSNNVEVALSAPSSHSDTVYLNTAKPRKETEYATKKQLLAKIRHGAT